MERNDDYLTLGQAAKRTPGRPHASTIWRWCRKGVKTRRGDRVHLKHVRAGARVFTKEEWLTAFFEQVAEADVEHFAAEQQAPRFPLPLRRRTEAEAECERLGI